MIRGGLIGSLGTGGAGTGGSTVTLSDGIACYRSTFSGIVTTSFNHGLSTEDLVVEFRDLNGNLLLPDNWQVTGPNTIDVEFATEQQGEIVVLGCVTSGLAPITGGVTLVEGLSGIIDLDSPNNSIVISTSGQVINLNALFTPASGAIIDNLSNQINNAGVTSLQGLSGALTLTSNDNTVAITTSGSTIDLSVIGGVSGSGTVVASGTSCSALNFSPASGTSFVLQHDLGTQDFVGQVWDTTGSTRQSIMASFSPSGDNHVVIDLDVATSGRVVLVGCNALGSGFVDNRTIIVSGTGGGGGNPVDSRQASGSIIPDMSGIYDLGLESLSWAELHVDKVDATSGCFVNRPTVGDIEVALVTDTPPPEVFASGVENLNGLQGDVALVSNDGSVSIQVVSPDNIDFSFNQIVSGIITSDSYTEDFTTASGTLFVMQHDLGVENFTFNIWDKDTVPQQSIEAVNVAPSGFNHVIVELSSPMNGRLVLTNGGSDSGLIPVDKRQTVGNIVPVASGSLNIGQETLPFATIEADSFKKRTEEVGLEIHTPVGMIVPYAASGAPRGWLFCDGAAVSRSQYADLFNAIGTTFGIGDGVTTFNLPDLRARTIIGQNINALPNSGINNSARTTKTFGSSGGAETHTLSISEMPQHDHTQRQGNTSGIGLGPAPGTFGTNITNTSITTTDAGGDQAHNNMQPYLTLNYIIRF